MGPLYTTDKKVKWYGHFGNSLAISPNAQLHFTTAPQKSTAQVSIPDK